MIERFVLKELPVAVDVETKAVLKQLAQAHRYLAELKGVSKTIPNQGILINTLPLLEAKDSSAIENIITTHDELYKESLFGEFYSNASAKEVQNYSRALRSGYETVLQTGLLTNRHILDIQECIKQNRAGFRTQSGTELVNDRTGRILNILYLVNKGLLDIPVLYLSRYIIRHKGDYYRLLQDVRDTGNWEAWILFMLAGIEQTAQETIDLVTHIRELMQDYKKRIRDDFKFYSQDLLNNLFSHPYTKIEFLEEDLQIHRQTASKYLDDLVHTGFLRLEKIGKHNFYINEPLFNLFTKWES